MATPRNPKFVGRRGWRETAGLADPRLDTFSDVRRALNDWCLRNDKVFLKLSAAQNARNARIRQEKEARATSNN